MDTTSRKVIDAALSTRFERRETKFLFVSSIVQIELELFAVEPIDAFGRQLDGDIYSSS